MQVATGAAAAQFSAAADQNGVSKTVWGRVIAWSYHV
jgi:hypothetical protein